jgi:hypothetical protein
MGDFLETMRRSAAARERQRGGEEVTRSCPFAGGEIIINGFPFEDRLSDFNDYIGYADHID